VLQWVEAALREQGHARTVCKRLALLVAGLLSGDRGTPQWRGPRRVHSRAWARPSRSRAWPAAWPACSTDPQLDPARLLPALAAALLPTLLADGAVSRRRGQLDSDHGGRRQAHCGERQDHDQE